MKKKWAAGGAAFAIMIPSLGLALAAPTSAAAQSQIVIRVLNPDWGTLADNWQTWIGQQFTKSHPNIKVEFQFVPGNELDTKALLAINSGHPPNLVVVYQDVALLAKKGALVPLGSDFSASHINPNIFVKANWGTVLFDGQPYAFPAASTPGDVLWYNPQAMKAVGLNPNDPPRTWKQLMTDSLKAVKFGAKGNLERIGLEISDSQVAIYGGLFSGGMHWWKRTPSGLQPDPDNAANVAMLDYMKKLVDAYGGWQKYSKFAASDQVWNGPIDYLAQGKALFRIGGYWDYAGFAQYSPKFDYAATYAPTPNGKLNEELANPVTQWAVAFPKGQSKAEFNAAWQFANWSFNTHSYMLGPTTNGSVILSQQKRWIQYTIQTMTRTQKHDAPYLHFATDVLPYAKQYWPSLPITSYYQGQLGTLFDNVMLGKQTPQQALQQLQQNLQTQMMISGS